MGFISDPHYFVSNNPRRLTSAEPTNPVAPVTKMRFKRYQTPFPIHPEPVEGRHLVHGSTSSPRTACQDIYGTHFASLNE